VSAHWRMKGGPAATNPKTTVRLHPMRRKAAGEKKRDAVADGKRADEARRAHERGELSSMTVGAGKAWFVSSS